MSEYLKAKQKDFKKDNTEQEFKALVTKIKLQKQLDPTVEVPRVRAQIETSEQTSNGIPNEKSSLDMLIEKLKESPIEQDIQPSKKFFRFIEGD